jgi:hypothetical protein
MVGAISERRSLPSESRFTGGVSCAGSRDYTCLDRRRGASLTFNRLHYILDDAE